MEIDFDKMHGLAPAVVQDAATGELLMVGFMNRQALEMTLRTRFVTFYSRTRQTLWTKGETSGNRLEVAAAWTDCDQDTVLLRVRVLGSGRFAIRDRDPASRRNCRSARGSLRKRYSHETSTGHS
jgi:phosphoribosyl-AMP cyclohydrolase